MAGGKVVALGGVLLEVIKFERAARCFGEVVLHELPIPAAECAASALFVEFPIEEIMRFLIAAA